MFFKFQTEKNGIFRERTREFAPLFRRGSRKKKRNRRREEREKVGPTFLHEENLDALLQKTSSSPPKTFVLFSLSLSVFFLEAFLKNQSLFFALLFQYINGFSDKERFHVSSTGSFFFSNLLFLFFKRVA